MTLENAASSDLSWGSARGKRGFSVTELARSGLDGQLGPKVADGRRAPYVRVRHPGC